jgi:hypothetical protein
MGADGKLGGEYDVAATGKADPTRVVLTTHSTADERARGLGDSVGREELRALMRDPAGRCERLDPSREVPAVVGVSAPITPDPDTVVSEDK